ncbi:MAG: hypothetical protein B7Z75_12650 [Acidocella sp. 20-57-95]|nr:MAG: hypothetical protein B7Z75_12650 [Acidocella sp. 20-57-95]OYV62129.1 MAG: hypothetical protein B7Z71_02420 [Acidocella sp. 21-58-7]HQT65435.1 hypothetical protein [Acidocella sp.]HQU03402.1 hypothetical protein [Acidocella sp.]
MVKNWLPALLLTLPFSIYAQAQAQVKAPDAFANVMQNQSHRAAVLDAARHSPAWSHMGCPSATFTPQPEIGVYAPIQFDPAGNPIAGAWREGLIATGCGTTLTLNVLTKVTAPATLVTGPLEPGGTIAEPTLQNAAQASVVAAAGGIPPACHDAFISNTTFNAYEGSPDPSLPKGEQAAPWSETWTLNICGPTKDVTIHFTPTATSVGIHADPAAG